MQPRRFPIGIQDFHKIRTENFHYVDKTDLVYQLTHDYSYVFLSRPRRFGKSLLVSTLQCYFEARKELFEGLRMMELEQEWEENPVIRLDLSSGKYYELEVARSVLHFTLLRIEQQWGLPEVNELDYGSRLTRLIEHAHQQTGKPVVVLIDEYDAPLLDSIGKPELMEEIRGMVRNLFSPLKALGGILRFVFLTGISKFSQLSIFSELNNLCNISLMDSYAAICGITEQEVLDNFRPDIERMGEKQGWDFEAAFARLKQKYDGYHFSAYCPDIYNPFSLIRALDEGKYNDYWFATGTPTFLLEMLQEQGIPLPSLEELAITPDVFDRPTEHITSPIPVLYQSGYLTIKEYDEGIYVLGIPNEEVRVGLSRCLYEYLAPYYNDQRAGFSVQFVRALRKDDVETAMRHLQSFLAGFPYDLAQGREVYFQTILYTVFHTLNFITHAEVKTATGRIDLLVETSTSLFLMELKYDRSPEEALAQIDNKNYALPYAQGTKRLFKVGINFSMAERTVTEWKVVEA